jgi:hypothetical protein
MDSEFSVDTRSEDDMICQVCLAKKATPRVSKRAPGTRCKEGYYCTKCYEAKDLKPPLSAQGFPRPSFTIKSLITLVAGCAFVNAVTAWVMRSGYIVGTPDQLRRWSISACVWVNLIFGFFVMSFSLTGWLGRVMWYKRTGGMVPTPQLELTPSQIRAAIIWIASYCVWWLFALVFAVWLVPKLWPMSGVASVQLFVVILFAPLLLIVVLCLLKNRAMRNRIRQGWTTMSRPEQLLGSVTLAWCVGVMLVLWSGGPNIIFWGVSLWFPFPPVLLIGIVVALLLTAATAMSTRRR